MQKQDSEVPLIPMEVGQYQGFTFYGKGKSMGKRESYTIRAAKALERVAKLRAEAEALQRGNVLKVQPDGPGSKEAATRLLLDQNISKTLGGDPALMTREEYARQGASFAAMAAPAVTFARPKIVRKGGGDAN